MLMQAKRACRRPRKKRRPALGIAQILAWADAYHRRRQTWPVQSSGRVRYKRGLTWAAINAALRTGTHGLPGGDSLARLLRRCRHVGERRGRRPCPKRCQRLQRLYSRGYSAAAIGRLLGVSRQAAWEQLKRFCTKKKPPKRKPAAHRR